MKVRCIRKLGYILTTILILTASQNVFSEIIMQPYLQAVTDSSIVVMTETDSKDPVNVWFRQAGGGWNLTRSVFYVKTDGRKKTYVHRNWLKNLKPGEKYEYLAGKSGLLNLKDPKFSPPKSDTLYTCSFTSGFKEGSSFRFAVMGDCRSGVNIHSVLAKQMKAANPLFSIYLGDLCYNPEYYSWKNEFFIQTELDFITEVPFFNSVGNHEGWKQNAKAFQQAPDVSPDSKQQAFYSFDYGDIHFVVMNNEISFKPGSDQWNFISEDLRNTKKKWKIVAGHYPAYCVGGHGNDANLVKMTSEIFEPNKVDIVLGGHSHFYQHNLVNGIRHMVFGGGGAPLYSPKDAPFTIKSVKDYNFAVVDASPDELKMTVFDINSKIIDSYVIKK